MAADQVSSIFWLLHSDLHEIKFTSVLECLSSMVASVEPFNQAAFGQRVDLENLSMLEQNFRKGKFHVRFKRRNGRVRVMVISMFLYFCGECADLLYRKSSYIYFTPLLV